jgi:hypothetical protein
MSKFDKKLMDLMPAKVSQHTAVKSWQIAYFNDDHKETKIL